MTGPPVEPFAPPVGWLAMAAAGFGFNGPIVSVVPTPAVGTDWSYGLDTNVISKVKAVTATLTTATLAGNRWPVLEYVTPNGQVLLLDPAVAAIAASLTVQMNWATQTDTSSAGAPVQSQPAADMWLPPGTIVKTVTTLLAPGDQWTNVVLLVEQIPYSAGW